MGIYSLPGMQNLVWYRLMKSCFGWHHTFQHCLVIFKLNKVAKHLLNLAKSINQHEWNWTQDSIASVFSHHVFSSATETWDWYGNVLPSNTLLATLLCLGSYEQCCTQLLKVLYKCCNTDVVRVYWYICTLPWALHALESHAYILVKPLATMLQYNNVATIL